MFMDDGHGLDCSRDERSTATSGCVLDGREDMLAVDSRVRGVFVQAEEVRSYHMTNELYPSRKA